MKTETPPRPSLESVSTINEDGSRRFIHTAKVTGRFARWRAFLAAALMALYVAMPWIQINGNPMLFLDLKHRQFHYLGFTFVSQDVWIVFFVMSGIGFCLFFLTSLLGRVWCGWACPQTIFLDVARRIDRLCEGDAMARRKLDSSPWTLNKTVRRFAKHALYILYGLLLSHVLLSYFVSIPKLYAMMQHSPRENLGSFAFVFLIAGALWFNFAWFREQFCIVLCPYGRFQSALLDSDSLVVGYDVKRGEPRGKKGTTTGDCIDCLRCVQVCPTGIDIRQGLQLECIGCTACIDACDAVMKKLDRKSGLIRYDSRHGFEGKPTRWIRPRTLLYTGLAILGAIALTIETRAMLRPATFSLTRVTGIPYVVDGGVVRNQFLVRVLNKRNAPVTFRLEVADGPKSLQATGAEGGIAVAALGEEIRTIVLTLPRADLKDLKKEIPLSFRIVSGDGTVIEKTATFLGPVIP